MAADDVTSFPVQRMKDNRLQGLLREIEEAIKSEDDAAVLRTLGQSLKLLGDCARSRGFERQTGQRFW